MGTVKHPARIFATVNGASTRLPDGHRQLIGGWSEDAERPGAQAYVLGDIAGEMLEALKECRELFEDEESIRAVIDDAIARAEGRL